MTTAGAPAAAPFTIRPCAAADLAAVQAIYALEVQEGTASFELTPPDLAEMQARWQAVRAAGAPWLVAEQAGQVVGYAYAGAYRPRPAYRFTGETSVYLARTVRRQGIGSALLDALIPAATAAGLRQLVAIIGDSANLASIRLHERAGFAHVGTLRAVGYKFERWLDTVLMQRALD